MRAAWQCKHGAAVDHALQRPFAGTHIGEQTVAKLADEADALWDAGERRRERRLPLARHDQCRCVVLLTQPRREPPLLAKRDSTPRQVPPDGLAQARPVLGG